jgi:SAM-dependent methyltransferase
MPEANGESALDNASACIVCGGRTEGTVLFGAAEWRVVKCGGCGLVRQWPPLPEEQAAAIYGNIYPASAAAAGSARPAPARKARRGLGNLRDEIADRRRPGRFLDIGCSYGELTESLAARGWQATGIDVCAAAVEDARSRGLDCRVSSVESYKPDAPFDAIAMNHVLEHVPDPLAALGRIGTWLAAGGALHIRVPNVAASPLRRRAIFVGELKPYEHLFYYSADTMERLLRKAGFSCEIATGGVYPLGAAINALVRTRLVASARWQKYNYFSPSAGKSSYFAARRIYEAFLSVFNRIPMSHDREVRAVATVER